MFQQKGILKMLGLNHLIQYKEKPINTVGDALSIREHKENSAKVLYTVTATIVAWVSELSKSYASDSELLISPQDMPLFHLYNELLRYKGIVVLSNNESL